jgi:hypothetical protein
VRAHPRNLTGSNGRLRKDKRQKTNMQKAGTRWTGRSDGDIQQPVHLQQVFYIQWQTRRWSNSSGGWGNDTVVIRNRRNLRSLLSGRKHLRKSSSAAFCPCPILWLGLCPTQPSDYLTQLCLCQVLIGFSYSALHS